MLALTASLAGDDHAQRDLRPAHPEHTGPRYPEAVLQLREIVAFQVIEEAGTARAALDQAQQEVEAIG